MVSFRPQCIGQQPEQSALVARRSSAVALHARAPLQLAHMLPVHARMLVEELRQCIVTIREQALAPMFGLVQQCGRSPVAAVHPRQRFLDRGGIDFTHQAADVL